MRASSSEPDFWRMAARADLRLRLADRAKRAATAELFTALQDEDTEAQADSLKKIIESNSANETNLEAHRVFHEAGEVVLRRQLAESLERQD